MKEPSGFTIWFTGLSGSGKTTLSDEVAQYLVACGCVIEQLDGDAVRKALGTPPDFSREGRERNIRTLSFIANLLSRNGIIVLVSAISPYRQTREDARQLIGDFIEVYVNTPLSICELRDVKGLYQLARSGEIKNFTGINDPYEPPLNAEVECQTDQESVEESRDKVLMTLRELSYL
jgi:adenylylsulfate kinase